MYTSAEMRECLCQVNRNPNPVKQRKKQEQDISRLKSSWEGGSQINSHHLATLANKSGWLQVTLEVAGGGHES